ncbi:hypothetical protein [Jhaorihella thermophila]|uniref:DUF2357 domain-containing protein n=1 Tax=Jhaorihella thermophila TaxID=488547 RepID=A0A1H5YJL6_9RHOB|nr:hypothetical protein [Jhaorihella thermophila]SEG23727.1 hypothetical protein SAMN05421751_1193 [Jhaorihella thermophila]
MKLIRRPWSHRTEDPAAAVLGPSDCLLGEATGSDGARSRHAVLLARDGAQLRLYPYPKTGRSDAPCQIAGLPARPRIGLEPRTEEETVALAASARMHRVLARIHEVEGALDDPENLWPRLQAAWDRAENEADPRMAEIVRQSQQTRPHVLQLESRIRRVLRRNREMVPLDRVQEMDRASMLWMVRQPGRSIAERAGADQRVLAIARHEDFNTLENRVFHAYLRLAERFARQWLREHKTAQSSQRYRNVESYQRLCRRLSRELRELNVGVADPDVTDNYVLMEDRAYRAIRRAWDKLLRQNKAEDELWAWQAQSWTDFCVLAVTLALHGLDEAQLLAQAPLIWLDEAVQGRRFLHDRPLAVFWLRDSGLIVEVQARPERVSRIQFAARAHVWLRVTDLNSDAIERRVPVWTPHSFDPMDLRAETQQAATLIEMLRRHATHEVMREGVILAPADATFDSHEATSGGSRVRGIAFDARGAALRQGKQALAGFVRSLFTTEAA